MSLKYELYKYKKTNVTKKIENIGVVYKIITAKELLKDKELIIPQYFKKLIKYNLIKTNKKILIGLCIDKKNVLAIAIIQFKNYFINFLGYGDLFIGPVVTDDRYRKKNYMYNLINYILNKCDFNNVVWIVKKNNFPSINLCKKIGFEKSGNVIRKHFRYYYLYNNIQYVKRERCIFVEQYSNEIISTTKLKNINYKEKTLLARYITDFDSKINTTWYAVIREKKYDLETIDKSEKRKFIKAIKYTYLNILKDNDIENMYKLYITANKRYSKSKLLTINEYREYFTKSFKEKIVYGLFTIEANELVAYLEVKILKDIAKIDTIKINQQYFKHYITYSLFYYVINDVFEKFQIRFVTNGEMAIRHDTNMQSFLIKRLSFRKAFCVLNIIYSNKLKIVIKVLYIFKFLIKRLTKYVIFKDIYVLLEQEKYRIFSNKRMMNYLFKKNKAKVER